MTIVRAGREHFFWFLLFFARLDQAAGETANAPKPDRYFKIECRLLEMSAEKADLIARTLLHSTIEHEKEARLVRETLAGDEVKNLAALNGQSARDGKVRVEGLEADGEISPDAKTCDLNLAFHFDGALQGANTLSDQCVCSVWNGFPTMLARTDHGRIADVAVAWISWDPVRRGLPNPAKEDREANPSGAVPGASGQDPFLDSAGQMGLFTVEVRLLEIPSSVAALVETALVEWDADPEAQARRLSEILGKHEVRQVTSLSTICRNGSRTVVKNLAKAPAVVPHGDGPAIPADEQADLGDTLEVEPVIAPDSPICDLNCAYRRTCAFDDNRRVDELQCFTSLTVRSGLPMLLARCDHGKSSELVLVRATFPTTDQAKKSDPHISTSQIYVRGRVVSIGREFAAEANRLKGDPKGLARWLQQHGTTESILSIVTKSGQRAVFEDIEKQAYRLPDNTVATYTAGPSLEVEPVIESGDASIALGAVVNDYQVRESANAMGSRVGGRYLKGDVSVPSGILIGGGTAVPCREFTDPPSKSLPAFEKLVPTDDVFVVFEPLMSRDHGSGQQ